MVSDGTFESTVNGEGWSSRHEQVGDWNEAASELDAIVASFDEGEVSVDDLFVKLERATAIIEALEARLDATKAKVDELAPRICRRSPRRMSERVLLPPAARRDATSPLGDPVAEQMVNFVYAFGDRETGEAVLVDPAYRPSELVELVEADGMKVSRRRRDALPRRPRGRELQAADEIAGIVELLETHRRPDPRAGRRGRVGDASATGVGGDSLVAHDAGRRGRGRRLRR